MEYALLSTRRNGVALKVVLFIHSLSVISILFNTSGIQTGCFAKKGEKIFAKKALEVGVVSPY